MDSTYMGNFNYLRDVLDIDPVKERERFEECQAAMEKYTFPWWYELRHRPEDLALHQVDEPVLLIRWSVFKKGVETVLGRELGSEELCSNNKDLLEAFKVKYLELINN